ncbi:MAG: DNA polymerase I [Bdellovibrionota bacterium]|nr:MAG: DNA polymerase I [Bdellovibrionota bacterium]
MPQMPLFREFSRALGLPVLELPGYEADDLIGTLSARLTHFGIPAVVVSGDKDLLQLVSSSVEVWDTMKDRRYGRADVIEKFGVPPEHVVDFLGLTGDSSDNIPGLKGVGPKTAAQLISKYGEIENIINKLAEVSADSEIRGRAAIVRQIEENPQVVRLSRRLAEVLRDAPLPLGERHVVASELSEAELLAALVRQPPQTQKLRALIEQCEFTSIGKELEGILNQKHSREVEASFATILAPDFGDFLLELKQQKEFAFDLETTSLDTLSAQIVGASFCWQPDKAYYVPIGHKGVSDQISIDDFVAALTPILSDASVHKVGQNLKYDIEVLQGVGIDTRGVHFDSMLAAYVLAPDKGSYDLTTLARDYLQLPTIEFDELVEEGGTFADVPLESAARYAGQDALYAWLLKDRLAPQLRRAELEEVFYKIEMPLVPILASMERAGVLLDTALLAKMSEEFEAELTHVRTELYDLCGGEFNLNSPKQLAEVLFQRLGISTKGLKRTKTGISTDSSVLEKIRTLHPAADLILRFRFLHKLKSTYIDALAAQCSAVTGRIHTRFNQAVTGTGRLSSSEPNLQNIPIQTPEGRRIRRAFIAPPGSLLLSADYSQIELRVLAHMSGDQRLCKAFKDDLDIHAATTREILGLASDAEVTPEQRRIGKTINFGIIYGMSAFRLSKDLEIPVAVANSYIEEYFKRYPGVRRYLDTLEQDAKRQGFVTTMYGRKRIISDIDASDRDYGFLNRVAMNAPIQGSAADIMKLAMIAVQEAISGLSGVRLLLQIHDELLLELPRSMRDVVTERVQQAMEQVASLAVPLKIEVGWGENWEEAHA